MIMIAFANAKINLGLYVTGKRTDGFHDLESIFLPVSLCDVVEIIPSDSNDIEFQSLGISVDGNPHDNLCVRSYDLLKKDFNIPGVNACLLKNIPIGAGLGGGSSDAAVMLKLLNDFFSLKLSRHDLKKYAEKLGSDCPFFIDNKPVFVTGRGEIMDSIALDLSNKFLMIVHPGIHVSTASAYSMIIPQKHASDIRELVKLPMKEWRQNISNDFEKPMIELHPEIGAIKDKLYAQGAIYASMSGSGSAVYGIFDSPINGEINFSPSFSRSCKFN